MACTPRATSRNGMEATIEERGALGGERVIKYNIFLSDSFKGPPLPEPFYMAPGDNSIVENDDSYRQSRHLLKRVRLAGNEALLNASSEDDLREKSLARQLQTKEDSPATIRLIRRLTAEELAQKKSTEPNVPWVNLIPPNTKFFLEAVQENREEKVQVLDTFGEWIAFFFGRKPEVYSYSGTLLNAKNHDWKNEFQINYDEFLRGSQAVKYKATVLLQYDDVMVEGYILNSSIQMTSVANNAVPFSFNMLVINRAPINYRSILAKRLQRSGGTFLERALLGGLEAAVALANRGAFDQLETFFFMREYFSGHYEPGAGTASHRPEKGNFEVEVSTTPGQKSGLTNDKPEPCAFEPTFSNKIAGSGVNFAALSEELE